MQLVLVEVVKHELHVTLHDSQTISNVCNMNGCVYAFEMSSTSARDHSTSADDVVNIIALSCDSKKARRLILTLYFSSLVHLPTDDAKLGACLYVYIHVSDFSCCTVMLDCHWLSCHVTNDEANALYKLTRLI